MRRLTPEVDARSTADRCVQHDRRADQASLRRRDIKRVALVRERLPLYKTADGKIRWRAIAPASRSRRSFESGTRSTYGRTVPGRRRKPNEQTD